MKIQFNALLMMALLPAACNVADSVKDLSEKASTTSSSVSASDAAANQLYLDDMVDSAAEEDSTSSDEGDSSVTADTKDGRLAQMVAKLITELDADASGSLSLEEFLVLADKRASDQELDDETKAKIVAKMTEDFTTYAGDDAILSSDELKTLLKAVAPRVGCHRQDNFPGQQEQRVQETWDDIIAKYDADGDGLLSQSEYEAMEAARKAEHDAQREEGRGGPGGPGEGRGTSNQPPRGH